MSFSTPRTWVTGELVTASILNTFIRDQQLALDAGRLSVASQAARDIFFASSSTAIGRLAAGTSGYFLKTQSTGADPVWAEVTSTISVLAKSADYTVTVGDAGTDCQITVDASGGDRTITLYASSSNSGRQVKVKKIDSSSNTVTIDGNSSETIDGSTTQVISAQYTSLSLVCDGSNWHIF